jgi:hypothetical protein
MKATSSDSGAEMPPAMAIVRKKLDDEFKFHLDEDFSASLYLSCNKSRCNECHKVG